MPFEIRFPTGEVRRFGDDTPQELVDLVISGYNRFGNLSAVDQWMRFDSLKSDPGFLELPRMERQKIVNQFAKESPDFWNSMDRDQRLVYRNSLIDRIGASPKETYNYWEAPIQFRDQQQSQSDSLLAEFSNALERSAPRTFTHVASGLTNILAETARVLNVNEAAQQQWDATQQRMQRVAEDASIGAETLAPAPKIDEFRKVHGWDDFTMYLAQAIGNQVPVLGSMMLAGAPTGGVGAIAAGMALESGSIQEDLIREGFDPAEANKTAALYGVMAGSLEGMPIANFIRRTPGLSKGFKSWVTGTLKNMGTQAIEEAATEGLQTVVERSAADYLHAMQGDLEKISWATPEGRRSLWHEASEAMVQGGLIGALLGGGGGGARTAMAQRGQEAAAPELTPDQPAAGVSLASAPLPAPGVAPGLTAPEETFTTIPPETPAPAGPLEGAEPTAEELARSAANMGLPAGPQMQPLTGERLPERPAQDAAILQRRQSEAEDWFSPLPADAGGAGWVLLNPSQGAAAQDLEQDRAVFVEEIRDGQAIVRDQDGNLEAVPVLDAEGNPNLYAPTKEDGFEYLRKLSAMKSEGGLDILTATDLDGVDRGFAFNEAGYDRQTQREAIEGQFEGDRQTQFEENEREKAVLSRVFQGETPKINMYEWKRPRGSDKMQWVWIEELQNLPPSMKRDNRKDTDQIKTEKIKRAASKISKIQNKLAGERDPKKLADLQGALAKAQDAYNAVVSKDVSRGMAWDEAGKVLARELGRDQGQGPAQGMTHEELVRFLSRKRSTPAATKADIPAPGALYGGRRWEPGQAPAPQAQAQPEAAPAATEPSPEMSAAQLEAQFPIDEERAAVEGDMEDVPFQASRQEGPGLFDEQEAGTAQQGRQAPAGEAVSPLFGGPREAAAGPEKTRQEKIADLKGQIKELEAVKEPSGGQRAALANSYRQLRLLEKGIEPWEMTKDEYLKGAVGPDEVAIRQAGHAKAVRAAVLAGKKVPAEVLEAYKNNGWAKTALEAAVPATEPAGREVGTVEARQEARPVDPEKRAEQRASDQGTRKADFDDVYGPGDQGTLFQATASQVVKKIVDRYDLSEVRRALKGWAVERTDRGWKLSLPGWPDIEVVVFPDLMDYKTGGDQALWDRTVTNLWRSHFSEEMELEELKTMVRAGHYGVAGYFKRIDKVSGGHIIALSGAKMKSTTLFHESFHFAFHSVLNPGQRQAILDTFGTEEKAAEEYAKLLEAKFKLEQGKELNEAQKALLWLWDWAKRFVQAFIQPDLAIAHSTFEKIQSGGIWMDQEYLGTAMQSSLDDPLGIERTWFAEGGPGKFSSFRLAEEITDAATFEAQVTRNLSPEGTALAVRRAWQKGVSTVLGGRFYSKLGVVVRDTKQKKWKANEFIAYLKKQPGVKEVELFWTGLEDWLQAQDSVNLEDVQLYLENNGVEVQETLRSAAGTKWGDPSLVLPGGKNYRELTLTLLQPQRRLTAAEKERLKELFTKAGTVANLTAEEEAEQAALLARTEEEGDGYTSHAFPEKNILVWIRFNERVGADGKKILFIEEIQSDWHQEGAKKGYRGPKVTRADFEKDGWTIKEMDHPDIVGRKAYLYVDRNGFPIVGNIPVARTKTRAIEMAVEYANQNPNTVAAVPDAPFKGTGYQELAMKRMILWAVENGFDRVAWTSGEQQAERYSLEGKVQRISWDTNERDGKVVQVVTETGAGGFVAQVDENGVITSAGEYRDQLNGKALSEVIGKEMAEKILTADKGKLEGEGLKVGGEGKRTFYDKLLRNVTNKIAKRFGAKVDVAEMETGPQMGLDITNAMRDEILSHGLELMQPDLGAPPVRISHPDALYQAGVQGDSEHQDAGVVLARQTVKEWFREKVMRQLFDKLEPIQRLQEVLTKEGKKINDGLNAYLKARNFSARAGALTNWVQKDLFQPFIDKIAKMKIDLRTFDEFRMAVGALESNPTLFRMHVVVPRAALQKRLDQMTKLGVRKGMVVRVPDLDGVSGKVVKVTGEGDARKVQVEYLDQARGETRLVEYDYKDVMRDSEAEIRERLKKIDDMVAAGDDPKKGVPHSGIPSSAAREMLREMRGLGLIKFDGEPNNQTQYSGKLWELSKLFDKVIRWKEQTLVDSGLLSKAELDLWRKDHPRFYCPMRGDGIDILDAILGGDRPPIPEIEAYGGKMWYRAVDTAAKAMGYRGEIHRPNVGRGYNPGSRPAARRRLGRHDLPTHSPTVELFTDALEVAIRSEKNRVAQTVWNLFKSLAHLVDRDGKPLFIFDEPPEVRYFDKKTNTVKTKPNTMALNKPNVYDIWIDGERHYVRSVDPSLSGLYSALNNMGPEAAPRVLRMFSHVVRYISKMATGRNPAFAIPNLVRDLITAGIRMRTNMQDLQVDLLKSIPRIIKMLAVHARNPEKLTPEQRRRIEKWKAAGGETAYWLVPNLQTQMKHLQRDIERAAKNDFRVFRWARLTCDFLEDYNGALEGAVRFAVFEKALEKGYSLDKAGLASREVTVDFTRQGTWAGWLGSLYAFANASLQGSRMVYNTLKTPTGQKWFMGLVALGMTQALTNSWAGGEDEDDDRKYWDKLTAYEKSRNLVLMMPGGDGLRLKIPMPWGFNVPFMMGTMMMDAARGLVAKDKGAPTPWEAAGNIVSSAFGAFNPIGDVSVNDTVGWLQLVAPTWADPVVDIAFNRTFWGGPIMPEDTGFKRSERYGIPKKDHLRYFDSASRGSRATTQLLYQMTGISVSPESVDYSVSAAFGGLGDAVNKTISMPFNFAQRGKLSLHEVPIVRSFLAGDSQYYASQVYRESMADHWYKWEQWNDLKKESGEQAGAYYKRWGHTLGLHDTVLDFEKRVAALRKADVRTSDPRIQKLYKDFTLLYDRTEANARRKRKQQASIMVN